MIYFVFSVPGGFLLFLHALGEGLFMLFYPLLYFWPINERVLKGILSGTHTKYTPDSNESKKKDAFLLLWTLPKANSSVL